ncbi:tyrosine-type recombinase/integrase [Micropruina glycogenica]|uniref:Putative prophage phiRv2 integrase n=1 Tax=Micropruina glycogenica TaxID=75385 RepID=A0A2N9JF65_9ACTN|nr:site-specific integrase [Micropruina glycogenica]SPD86044.1 putative prophage phiRv2 integrase [Micropruina glycogenica]
MDAEGWLHEERKLIEANEWSPPKHRAEKARGAAKTPDFETYAKKWIAKRRTDKGEPLRASTRANYEATLEHHLVTTFGRMRLRDITKGAVRRWYEDAMEGNSDNPRAISKAYGLMRAIMNSAVDEDLIEASPVHIRGAGYQPKRRRLEPASIEELDVIVENMPEKWKLMVLLASWCALRYGEIAELRRKDIKLRHVGGRWTGVIQVRRGVVWVNRKIQVEPPKSEAGIRDVAIPPHLIPIIKAHLETFAAPGQEGLLFPAANGRQQWPSTITSYFKKAATIAGRSDLRFHDLRHTGAVMAAQQGATLADLQSRLGHSTANAALLYQHTAKGRDQLIADALSRLAT